MIFFQRILLKILNFSFDAVSAHFFSDLTLKKLSCVTFEKNDYFDFIT